jgi:hypothetical protein
MTHCTSLPLLLFVSVAPHSDRFIHYTVAKQRTPVSMESLMGIKTGVWSPGTQAGSEEMETFERRKNFM